MLAITPGPAVELMLAVNSIAGENASETWAKAASFLIQKGEKTGELSKEVMNLVSIVRDPSKTYKEVDELFIRHVGMKWIQKGSSCVFPMATSPKKKSNRHWAKSYWGRLTRYRERIDQLNFVIRRLSDKPLSKQLSCVVFDPEIDMQCDRPFNPSMPCLVAIDLKFRNGKLNLFAMFRSHDFGRKAYGNYIGLGRLLGTLCDQTGYEMGEIVCYSISAHIRAKELHLIEALLNDYGKCASLSLKKTAREATLQTYNLT